MHNCKETRKLLFEEALDEAPPDRNESLLPELEQCPACREEFAALRNALRVADQALQSIVPEENFWSGYHERLRQSLEREGSLAPRPGPETGASFGLLNLIQRLATASVRLPVPVAAVLIVLFGLTIVFAAQARRSPITPVSGTPSVITKTIEVPVIQERTVTRVVYRDINRPAPRNLAQERTAKVTDRKNDTTQSDPISLVGFKPTRDPKLTIIKGSYRDEK